jgi:hypothetical protein
MWDLVKIAIELTDVFSAIICFVLLWFMLKPYRLTGENRFLGLPLGFGIMGVSHIIAIVVTIDSIREGLWFMVLFRTFSFVFLAATYLFAGRASKKTQYLWNITLSIIIVVLFSLSLLVFVAPQLWENFGSAQVYWRIIMVICLGYIAAITLKNRTKSDKMALWIPFGFIFLTISQSLVIVYALVYKIIDYSIFVYWGVVALRFAGFIMFLLVAYRTYYNSKEDDYGKDS